MKNVPNRAGLKRHNLKLNIFCFEIKDTLTSAPLVSNLRVINYV